jgi:hypothetical protein
MSSSGTGAHDLIDGIVEDHAEIKQLFAQAESASRAKRAEASRC